MRDKNKLIDIRHVVATIKWQKYFNRSSTF